MMKVMVWFTNGDERTFPNVNARKIEEKDNLLTFEFGEHEHMARINLTNVNFYEVCDE